MGCATALRRKAPRPNAMGTEPLADQAGDPLRLEALRADARRAMGAAVIDADRLQVGQPAATRLVHRVADVVTGGRTLPTNFAALRHDHPLLSIQAPGGATTTVL